jgi:hypothetical protein
MSNCRRTYQALRFQSTFHQSFFTLLGHLRCFVHNNMVLCSERALQARKIEAICMRHGFTKPSWPHSSHVRQVQEYDAARLASRDPGESTPGGGLSRCWERLNGNTLVLVNTQRVHRSASLNQTSPEELTSVPRRLTLQMAGTNTEETVNASRADFIRHRVAELKQSRVISGSSTPLTT